MQYSHSQTSVLLVGEGVRQMHRLVDTFNNVGMHLRFADDSEEAMRTMFFDQPDIVLCEVDLPDGDGTELCRTMRCNKALSRIPFVLVSRGERGIASLFEALANGADDLLGEEFGPSQFLAKMIWLIERRNFDEARQQHFEALLSRQIHTLEIVRETSALFRTLAGEKRASPDSGMPFDHDQRIEMGLTMIGGLASILDEQVRAINMWDIPEKESVTKSVSSKYLFGELAPA